MDLYERSTVGGAWGMQGVIGPLVWLAVFLRLVVAAAFVVIGLGGYTLAFAIIGTRALHDAAAGRLVPPEGET